jgi:hypothetical protein
MRGRFSRYCVEGLFCLWIMFWVFTGMLVYDASLYAVKYTTRKAGAPPKCGRESCTCGCNSGQNCRCAEPRVAKE